MKILRLIKSNVPNTITCLNLLSGCIATVFAFHYDTLYGSLRGYEMAFIFIGAATLFDFCDGLAARLLHAYSALGKELDSLSDLVSFGLAPATLIYSTMAANDAGWLAYLAFIVTVFGALRLAKFNIDDTQRTEFCGLPSPAAGLFCASLGLLHAEGMLSLPYEAVLLAAAATAWLMISPIRMFALKFHGFGWTGNRLRYLFLGACVVLILTLGAYAIPAIFVLYVVVSLVRWLLQGRRAAEA